MNFSFSLRKWGTDDFRDAVQTDLVTHEADLPLDDFCEGGGPDWESLPDFEVDGFEESETDIIVKSTVHFQESIPTSCKDVNFKERRQGQLILRIDKNLGIAEVTADPHFERRNLENY